MMTKYLMIPYDKLSKTSVDLLDDIVLNVISKTTNMPGGCNRANIEISFVAVVFCYSMSR